MRIEHTGPELLAVGLLGDKSAIGDRIELLLRRGRKFSPRVSHSGVTASAILLTGLMLAGSIAPRWVGFEEPAFAQSAPRPSFDIASVKPGSPDDPLRYRLQPGGRYLVSGVTLQALIADAYGVQAWQISGLPAWAKKSEKFSIEAKTSVPIPPWPDSNKLISLMMQSLIEERFHLALHRETRQDTIYNLVIAKRGFKLKTADPAEPTGFEMEPGWIHSIAVPLEYLAGGLANVLQRPVYDKTGIAGKFDYRITYTPDDAPAADPSVPSIFTALEEQLGLRLESAKGPVETIVVDHVAPLEKN